MESQAFPWQPYDADVRILVTVVADVFADRLPDYPFGWVVRPAGLSANCEDRTYGVLRRRLASSDQDDCGRAVARKICT